METASVAFKISGMTCASCAARIEKRLNEQPNVTATVNFALEQAYVEIPQNYDIQPLISLIKSDGYGFSVVADSRIPENAFADNRIASDGVSKNVSDTITAPMLWFAGSVTVIVMALSMIPELQFPGWYYLALLLTLTVWLGPGLRIHRATIGNLRHGTLTMDTLITLSTTVGLGYSLWQLGIWLMSGTAISQPHLYFEAVCGIIFFILLGRSIELRARHTAASAIDEIAQLAPSQVTKVMGQHRQTIPLAALQLGDEYVVRSGETIATDGVITAGASGLNLAQLTGESKPKTVSKGDEVLAGAIVIDGQLTVKATALGADSYLGRLAKLVAQAQQGKAEIQRLADRISAIFVPVVVVIALVVWLIWAILGHSGHGVVAAVSVLIIACPCALGLATPTALLVASGRGAKLGIVINGPQVLERVGRISRIFLDKTGTITTGELTVLNLVMPDSGCGFSCDELLALTALAESASIHPIAKALHDYAAESSLPDAHLDSAETLVGQGVIAEVSLPASSNNLASQAASLGLTIKRRQRHRIVVGNQRLLRKLNLEIPEELQVAAWENRELTTVFVAVDQQVCLLIALRDEVRPNAKTAIARFRSLGVTPVVLTGDVAGKGLSGLLDIEEIHSNLTPEDKVSFIISAQQQGEQVAMVGDGINDVAALAQADVGMAMNQGADAAKAAADITLIDLDINTAVTALELAKATLRTIRGNFVWAFGYNVLAIPIAALGLLNPMIAGAAMAFSSVFVVMNSLRLRRFTPLRD